MTSLDVAFAAVAVIAAASGLLAVTTRHVVHAALWLVVLAFAPRVVSSVAVAHRQALAR